MLSKTCCFTGHSEVWDNISQALSDAVERHIAEYGVTDFLVGNYGRFDRMAAAAVKAAKTRHRGIRLYLMLPYRPELGRPLPDMEGYDNTVYPTELEGVPYRLAILRLNRMMIEDSDYMIAYVTHFWGGAATTLEYGQAKERKGQLHIENLADKL